MSQENSYVLQPRRREQHFAGTLAKARLARMDLTPEVLRIAVEAGERERRSCSTHNTPGGPGYRAYDETIRALRDEVKKTHRSPWRPGARNKLYGILHANDVLAVTVMTGDENTGLVGEHQPRSKQPKGSIVKGLARMHNGQSMFCWQDDAQPEEHAGDEETWVLLIHSAEDEVRFELSLPTQVDEEDRLCSWRERIILDPIVRQDPLQDLDELEEIDFEITRLA